MAINKSYNFGGGTIGSYVAKAPFPGSAVAGANSTQTPTNYGFLPSPPPVAVLQTSVLNSGGADGVFVESGFAPNAFVLVTNWLYIDALTANIIFSISDGRGHSISVDYNFEQNNAPASRAAFIAQASDEGVLTLTYHTAQIAFGASALNLNEIATITKSIFWEGDSRVDFDTSPTTNAAKILANLYNANYIHANDQSKNSSDPAHTTQIINIAQSGETLSAIRSEIAQPDAYLGGSETEIIYIIDAGVNDIGTGRTPQAAFADLQFIVNAQTVKGIRVFIETVCQANTTAAYQTNISIFNSLIRNNYPAAMIIDSAAVPELNNFSNPTYFQSDGIHYTDAGKQIKAQFTFDRLNNIVAPGSLRINKYFNFGGATVGKYIGTAFPDAASFSFSDGLNLDLSAANDPASSARFGSFAYAPYGPASFIATGLTPGATYQVIIDICYTIAKIFLCRGERRYRHYRLSADQHRRRQQ